jgi:uncharacterized protein (TIGR03083 family)
MEDAADLEVIAREGRRVIEFARRAPEARVPQYPTWTLRDLVTHVGAIHGRTSEICRTLAQERVPTARCPAGADPCDWAEERLEAMLDDLRTADPEARAWTFVRDTRLGFWHRRMVIETGVHRWDAQGAVEDAEPLLPLVAVHGLEEFPELYLPRLGDVPTLELHATDRGHTWRYGEGEPAASVEGTASDLFLRLMSRPGTDLPEPWEHAVDALGSPADAGGGRR